MTTTIHPHVLSEWQYTRQEMIRAYDRFRSDCADSWYSHTANTVAQFKYKIAIAREGDVDRWLKAGERGKVDVQG